MPTPNYDNTMQAAAEYSYGNVETLNVPSSGPYDLTTSYDDNHSPRSRAFVSGGVATAMSYKQRGQANFTLLGTTPPFIDLNPGDTIRLTYTIAFPPVVKLQAI